MEKELILAMKEEAEHEVEKLNDEIARAKHDIIYFEARRDFATELISRVESEMGYEPKTEPLTEDDQSLYPTEE